MNPEPVKKDRKSYLYWAGTLALTGVLLALALRVVDWKQTLAVLTGGRLELLLLACLILNGSYFARGLRWRVLLSATQPIEPLTVYSATMVGYLGNDFLPARAGELMRTVLLGRRTGLSQSFILGTIVTERLIDTVAVLALGSGTIFVLPELNRMLPAELSNAIRITGFVAIPIVIILLLTGRTHSLFERLLSRLPLSQELYRRIVNALENFGRGLQSFRHPSRSLKLAGLTLLIWLMDAGAAVVVAHSLSLSLTLMQSLFLMTALALSSAVPSTPGYIGVYPFVVVTLLPLFGLSTSDALAELIAFQGSAYVVVTIWGLWGLWHLSTPAPPAPKPGELA
jgi:glycosyltransferase 2 family protein